jgi:hypothetical protein
MLFFPPGKMLDALFIALAPGFSIGYLIDKNPAPAGYGPLIETGLEPA